MDNRRSVCPPAVFRRLRNKGLLPKGDDRLISFETLSAILSDFWEDDWYVKRILKKYSPAKRKLLTLEPDFNKVDRYIYKLYVDKLNDETPLLVKDVVSMVKSYFKFDCSAAHIRSIRRKAYYYHEVQRGRSLVKEDS